MSKNYTLGVEEEYLLLQLLNLTQGFMTDEFFQNLEAGNHSPILGTEVMDSHLEARTPVCDNVREVAITVKAMRKLAMRVTSGYGLTIASSATLPVIDWQKVNILPLEQVQEMTTKFGDTFKSQNIAGLHIHAGVGGLLEDSLNVINHMRWFLWIFAALSGSSRYYNGRDTGVSSYRLALMKQTGRTGLPPLYATKEDYLAEANALKQCGWSANKLWYYIRYYPTTETVELRICDSVPNTEDIVALVELFHNMVKAIDEGNLHAPSMKGVAFNLFAQENIDRAMCDGTNAVDAFTDLSIQDTLKSLPIDIPQGIWNILERGNTSEILQPIWQKYGSEGVTEYVATETVRNL